MKIPFSLEDYRQHPDWKIETRDGRNVEILYTDRLSERCVIALVNGVEVLYYYENGRGNGAQGRDCEDDLFFLVPDDIEHDGEDIRKALITYFEDSSIAYNELCNILPRLHTDEIIDWLKTGINVIKK